MRSRLPFSIWEKEFLRKYVQVQALNFSIASFVRDKYLILVYKLIISKKFNSSLKSIKTIHNHAGSQNPRVNQLKLSHDGEEKTEKGILGTSMKWIQWSPSTDENFSILETEWKIPVDPNHRYWARDILAGYLNLKDFSARTKYWNELKIETCGKFLPTILVQFMHGATSGTASLTPLDTSIFNIASDILQSKSLSWKDVEEWAYIVTADDSDEMTSRLCGSSHKKQLFILLHILHQNLNSVKSFEKLLICAWDLVLGKDFAEKDHELRECRINNCDQDFSNDTNVNKNRFRADTSNYIQSLPCSKWSRDRAFLDLYTFLDMVKLLLRHARKLWPASMVSIAHMTSKFIQLYVSKAGFDHNSLDQLMSRQLCYLINTIILDLSHQSFAEPYVMIVHNWESQKILLKLTAKFQPALVLNQASYRAIIQVLAAQKRTETQVKSVLRRARTWPPWSIPQHGMDDGGLTGRESSQVVIGVSRLKEAGYRGDWFDDALRVIGGQESDGTPTIQFRRILPWPSGTSNYTDEMNPNLWAARIIATRDVHEAWSAFVQFKKQGGQPNQEMYFEMFQKLTFKSILESRKRDYSNTVPGNGLEIWPTPENNYSDYYRRNLEPPSIEDLYSDMLRLGIKPHKRCLSFLVRNSRTPDEGMRYLHASGLSMDELRSLGAYGSHSCPNLITKVPLKIFADFLYLICRFFPRAVQVSPSLAKTSDGPECTVLHLKTKSYFGVNLDQPLHLAAYLLNTRRPLSHTPWYYFFRALTRSKTIISWEFVGQPENDILSWKVLRASFIDFSGCGLRLNTRGFSIICHGFDKYVRAILQIDPQCRKDNQTSIDDACKFIKKEFRDLSEAGSEQYNLPKLYHSIRGVHLHIYMRCLALVNDYDEIISTLEWMLLNATKLAEISRQESPISQQNFRKVLIVVGICCNETIYEHRARHLISSVDSWGGWPTDDEIEKYRCKTSVGAKIPV